ncbi:MAG: DMT family transporter [Proteobacteria bacterium]|nr:DMT family transporter [Pseudomonadota bacterium]
MTAPRSAIFIVAAIGATFCWGAGMTLTKLALGHFEPSLLLLVQLLASIAFLLIILLATGIRTTSWSQVLRNSGLGVLEPGLAYFLGLEGLNRISAAEAVVLSSTESIMIVLLAWMLAIERPRGVVLLLAIVGAAGAVLVAGSHLQHAGGSLSLWGDALVLGGVLSAAIYVVCSSRLASVTQPLPALIGQQVVAVVFATGIHLALTDGGFSPQSVPTSGWLLAVSSGIVQYACAFWLYLWALKGLRADEAGLYLSLIPVFGLMIAMPVLGERLTAMQWMGTLVIIGTIVVLTRLRDEQQAVLDDPNKARSPAA